MSMPPGPQEPAGGYGDAPPPPNYYGGASQPPTPPPPNYLVWAIISVFLCWPLAIPAIIFATQVNTKAAQGDAAGAAESSRKAKQFALWATILGGVAIVIAIIANIAGIALLGTVPTTTS